MSNALKISELTRQIDNYQKELYIINNKISVTPFVAGVVSLPFSMGVFVANFDKINEFIETYFQTSDNLGNAAYGVGIFTIYIASLFGIVHRGTRTFLEAKYNDQISQKKLETERLENELASLGYVYTSGLFSVHLGKELEKIA